MAETEPEPPGDVDDIISESSGFFRSRWIPTSLAQLADAEKRLFSSLSRSTVVSRYVALADGENKLWTVTVTSKGRSPSAGDSTPLVLVHGFGGGVGLWVRNYDDFADRCTVHAFDLLGFGRSSRPTFSEDAISAERDWVESIEQWRIKMGIGKMILLGHSLGGYLAGNYALEYPERVKHLILADPWGVPPRPIDMADRELRLPMWVRTAARFLSLFNPLASVRAVGPFGSRLVRKFRPDIGRRFASPDQTDKCAIYDYIYHCNARPRPTGEAAFRTMSAPFGWAKRPLGDRLPALDWRVPVTFIYGSRSWVDSGAGFEFQQQRARLFAPQVGQIAPVCVEVVKGAGHHVYVDQAETFNQVVAEALD